MTITTYTEGVCGDGTAILRDGVPMSVSEILDALNAAAVREAAPVALVDRRHAAAGGICWQNGGASLPHGTELFTAQPAPAYPENLPCPVHLLPGLKFGRGIPTRSMLDALKRRAEYEAELVAMTPEQKAEHDAAGEWLKSMLPTPAPAVPREIPLTSQVAAEYVAGWNACRAAMLSQPVSQGYKLPPGYKLAPNEPTESMVIDGFESDAFLSLADAVNEAKGWPYGCAEAAECVTGIFKAMIAGVPAAPEVSQ
ncbi:hypothetical protein [Serratia rubidaea]|uniref:hypothetical protein n=1 Tax=Serratia rubidaea TaxID=61652 RepID=UPI0022B920F4|nr:hypothetical protein [Serratia rubidaea]WBF44482.1 hypothetical protein OLD77_17820 [Serratia rubidaea]